MSSSQDIKSHFDNYVTEHPNGSYEDWIGSITTAEGGAGGASSDSAPVLLIEGVFGSIDESYYEQDSQHLQIWNNNLGGSNNEGKRISVTPRQQYQQEDGGSKSVGGAVTDLLGDGDEPISPVANYPSPVKPGEDLLSFD